ncbi:MAG: pyruvate ferredoxin oxidoreductase [Elusimicrobia bacterium]|nr:pyruvate ferredoxin oxidoreductase [Elusimicrobiota bacterium]
MPNDPKKRRSSRILTGNQAAAWAAYLARVQVVSAYPITPQTSIVETLAELLSRAPWPHRFINLESEHSAMASCIGASLAGARVFTATSSQGLLLMHELLHWASGARLPVVLVNVNRAVAPGWNIWADQQDSLSQRDTGFVQIYCETAQEVLDSVIIAYRLAEDVQLPVMVNLDAFFLSHTAEPVEIPSPEEVEGFLPARKPVFRLEVERPRAFGGLIGPEGYQRIREDLARAMDSVLPRMDTIGKGWELSFGRSYSNVEPYRMQDAQLALVASSSVAANSRGVVDDLRSRGVAIGLVRIRTFRPFPKEEILRSLRGVRRVAILDRGFSWGRCGILHQEMQSALYGLAEVDRPKTYGYIIGLGGRDATPELIQEAVQQTLHRENPEPETVWLNANRQAYEPPPRWVSTPSRR